MSYIVNVIEEDIANATRGSCNGCVVAVALKRELPHISFPLVDIQTIRYTVRDDGMRYLFLAPPEVQDYLVKFDAGDEITPFSFKLTTPIYTRSIHRTKHDHVERKGMAHIRTVSKGTSGGKKDEIMVSAKQPPTSSTSFREFGVRRMRINQGLKNYVERGGKGADA